MFPSWATIPDSSLQRDDHHPQHRRRRGQRDHTRHHSRIPGSRTPGTSKRLFNPRSCFLSAHLELETLGDLFDFNIVLFSVLPEKGHRRRGREDRGLFRRDRRDEHWRYHHSPADRAKQGTPPAICGQGYRPLLPETRPVNLPSEKVCDFFPAK